MTFKQMLRKKIKVDDKTVVAPEVITAGEIMEAAGADSKRRDLVISRPDGAFEMYSATQIIYLKDGSVFETQISSYNGSN